MPLIEYCSICIFNKPMIGDVKFMFFTIVSEYAKIDRHLHFTFSFKSDFEIIFSRFFDVVTKELKLLVLLIKKVALSKKKG